MKLKNSLFLLALLSVLGIAAAIGISCSNNPQTGSYYCTSGCPSEWVGDGECDNACYTATCNYDGGDCSYLECATGCPYEWVGDNECDTTCYTAACNWDGGDCSSSQPTATQISSNYCTTECPTSWLGDGMCDGVCNNAGCNYDNGDCSYDNPYLTFSNGGLTLTAETSESGGTKTTTITNSNGDTLLTTELTINGVRLIFPGVANPTDITFTQPLNGLPTNYAAGMAAAYVAGGIELSESGLMPDSPGCDWFRDTLCTLGCCADHDKCYHDYGCTWESWRNDQGGEACDICNAIVFRCIYYGCKGVSPIRAYDKCYDWHCNQYYDCPDIEHKVYEHDVILYTEMLANCACTSPCVTSTPTQDSGGSATPSPTQTGCFCKSGDTACFNAPCPAIK